MAAANAIKSKRIIQITNGEAGIDKQFSFHTSRHTFATMMLTLGTDLYTTSKLLGHADVKMTQVYAKIINQNKSNAINRRKTFVVIILLVIIVLVIIVLVITIFHIFALE